MKYFFFSKPCIWIEFLAFFLAFQTMDWLQSSYSGKFVKSRTKPKPYCAHFGKNQINLEKHLVWKHKMKKIKPCGCQAGIVATKIGLLKQTMSARQKTHICTPIISPIPIPDCHKEPVRLDNHLRSTHKI